VEQMVEQVGILKQGKLLFEGPLTELQRRSRGCVTLRLLYPQKGLMLLRSRGIRAEQNRRDGTLTLPPLGDEALAVLVAALAQADAGVIGVQTKTQSLEEIFLHLTTSRNQEVEA
ncbi:MAG: ABC transporter ATP-binding protein, partial [Gemmiger sp.]